MRHLFIITHIFILTILSFLSFSQKEASILDLLPGNGYFAGWNVKDSVEIFTGENLFAYIDGGADIYLEYGFVEVASCRYMNAAQAEIHAEVYRMTNDSAAFGVFTISTSVKGNPVECGTKAFIYDYYLDFWKGRYFVRCTSSRKETSVMDTLRLFAAFIDFKITEAGKEPGLTNVFRVDNIEFRNIKYIRGIIGLGNVFNFGQRVVAGFTEGVIGYFDDKLLFILSYPDDRNCREWFANSKDKMQTSQKFSEFRQVENGFTVWDKTGTNFCFVPFKRHIIIVKGMEWEEAKSLIEQIRKNLKN
jgi:hypothetical protein